MVIVGAGQAGLQIAESLRSEGWEGPIRLLGDEPHPPYHRPPLSKAWLLGEAIEAQVGIRGPEFLERKGIEHVMAREVAAIDPAARSLTFEGGETLRWAGLALATGARPRGLPVPGADLDGVMALRSLDDATRLAARLAPGVRVVVIGAGFIGLEVAAAAVKRGCEVTVVEAQARIMARAVPPAISAFHTELHARHGVRILLETGVTAILGESGRVRAVATGAGELPADVVVVGIGVVAADDLARAAGIVCERGIVVDASSRTSAPGVVAAGDCTVRRLDDGTSQRLESVQNAVEQAKSAAAALMGKDRPFTATPWFWSDQYDVKLQMAGLSAGATAMVTRGDPASGRFSLWHFAGDRLIAVDTVNLAQEHMAARRILDRGMALTPDDVAAAAFDPMAAARG
ncbi:FAD-dependent oxidoreductase [Pinisolibacter sp. B13]|nr:FAD-dependent oxidoreductase [Pinisolibacter aquiterrae]MBV5263033.1 FAD-dependent oxidoreductase [Pinisolibacter aquiterrae]